MQSKRNVLLLWAALFLLTSGNSLLAQEDGKKFHLEFFGSIGGEFRYFPEEGLYPGQKSEYFSSVFKPKVLLESSDRKHQVNFTGFARIDQYDKNRTHWDIRDFYWRYDADQWEINLGIKTLTWGKTESNNLVDIVNQYDLLEGRNLEYKLGQPLLQLVYTQSWGNLEFFVMSYLRELQFPGFQGRLRPGFTIHYDGSLYEEQNARYSPDYALRFSRYYGDFDFAVSHFYGTDRLPHFIQEKGDQMIPFYEEIHQTGLELQWLSGSTALKLEAIHQKNQRREIQALTLGGEYNIYFGGGPELKLMAEYSYDERGKEQINGMDDDLFLGLHLNLNDVQSSQLMVAGIYDFDLGTTLLRVHAEKRLGAAWKLSIAYNGIEKTNPQDFYHLIKNDSFLEISFLHYF